VRDTYPQIESEYIKTGKIRYALMDLPLERIHKMAFKASEATYCAKDQKKYWEMHTRLFENQRALEPWSGHAEAIGLDVAAFNACMESGKHEASIRADMKEAAKVGITGTPGFILARTDPKDPKKVTGISFIRGAQPFDKFKAEIDKELK
jgi:protein-disulfide isomerase